MKSKKPKHKEKNLRSISELIKYLRETEKAKKWFRGQSLSSWDLQPSLLRKSSDFDNKRELRHIERFKQHAYPFLDRIPANQWEWLFTMQHYNYPTRLLDWTENPLVALFFALAEGDKNPNKDAALWCLDPFKLNDFYKVNTVTLFSITEYPGDCYSRFLPGDTTNASIPFLAGLAERSFPRMQNQQSVFTIHSIGSNSLNQDVCAKDCILKYVIPFENCKKLKKELDLLGINEHFLFPSLDTIVRLIPQEK